MSIVVGPVLARPGGYAFDTWTVEEGLSRGYVHRRIEDAHQAAIDRAVIECLAIDASESLEDVCTCGTLEQFMVELVERGVLVTVLRELCSPHIA
jgi:hypothetical protein